MTSAILLALAAPAQAASKNVELVGNLPEAKNATAINFLSYGSMGGGNGAANGRGSHDVMLVTGRFGLKSYSLANPAKPRLLDEVTAEDLRLQGDPPVKYNADGTPVSTFWQNEDMDVDRERKLAILSRDPRAYGGSTSREPGEPDPNGATNIAGFYVVDAKDPRNLNIISFQQLPTGHTTTCINGCRWTWSGGPAATNRQRTELGWTGRPIIVTDLTNPAQPTAYPNKPIDLFRKDGVTAYSHDVQVDPMGIAWVSGDGGTRGYWTQGRHFDPLSQTEREATPLDPIPYGGGGLPSNVTNDPDGGFEHNAWRPVGASAPASDPRYRNGELLLISEEDFGPATEACSKQGMFTIASLAGSYDGDAWRSTKENPFRLDVVGRWNPFQKEGSRPAGQYNPLANFCSAHYFDVDGGLVTMAWYGEGTRFLDISDPSNPTQVAYWRPEDGIVWASYNHNGLIYTADRTRGVDILRLKLPAASSRRARRAVHAPAMRKRQLRFLSRASRSLRPDPATGGLCLLPRV